MFRDTMHPFPEVSVLSFLGLPWAFPALNENPVYWKLSSSKDQLFDRTEPEIDDTSREDTDGSDCAHAFLARKPRLGDVNCMTMDSQQTWAVTAKGLGLSRGAHRA
jgi:hypothetical protein